MKQWLESLPKFIIGPIAVILGIVYFVIYDPPKTICDTQFDIFKKSQEKYVFGYTSKNIQIPPGIEKDIKRCQERNSPGACYDWMEGLRSILQGTRNIPTQCGERLKQLDPLGKWFDFSALLFSQVSWNSAQTVRVGLYNWMESDQVALFCRLKNEYIRLRGAQAWSGLEKTLTHELVKIYKLTPKETWERTVLSHPCQVF